MKQAYTYILVFLLLLVLSTLNFGQAYQLGDVTGDGRVLMNDALAVYYYVNGSRLLQGNALIAADVNNDGQVTYLDGDVMAYYSIGKISYLPFSTQYGDVNLDGNVSAGDALLVALHYEEKEKIRGLGQQEMADVDGIPGIGILDALVILNYVVGNIDELPYNFNKPSADFNDYLVLNSQGEIVDKRFITDVNDETLPTEFALHQNYPNPFNPSTVINYSIPESGLVILKVFNILGQEVAELVNDVKSAGTYEVSFDANDLPAGVYVYTINAGNFTSTKKMLLLK